MVPTVRSHLGGIALEQAARRYLDLLKICLTRAVFPNSYRPVLTPGMQCNSLIRFLYSAFDRCLRLAGLVLLRPLEASVRPEGKDWPSEAETMIGLVRMQNLEDCVIEILERGVPGDLMETGVWRGGACIFMRGILAAFGDRERVVWAADSFQGLPRPDGRYPQDQGDKHWQLEDALSVPLAEVKANFARYGLLDRQVRFLEGWFKDTLPRAPIERLALLRLDGDMYSSTMDSLEQLYPKLSSAGFLIVDDYGAVPACRQAVDDYRRRSGIAEPMTRIDWSGVFWKKR
ncbi:MAG: TylF/MycF family methyltransferase [Bryobacteraceae bacterium]